MRCKYNSLRAVRPVNIPLLMMVIWLYDKSNILRAVTGKAGERPVVDDGDLVVLQPQDLETGKTSERPVVDGDDKVVVKVQIQETGKAGERPVVDDGDLPVVGQVQDLETGKASERPVVDGDDQAVLLKYKYMRAVRPVNAPLMMAMIRLTNCRLLYLNNKLLLKYKSRQQLTRRRAV